MSQNQYNVYDMRGTRINTVPLALQGANTLADDYRASGGECIIRKTALEPKSVPTNQTEFTNVQPLKIKTIAVLTTGYSTTKIWPKTESGLEKRKEWLERWASLIITVVDFEIEIIQQTKVKQFTIE
jgi:hypothetical protein